MEIEELEEEYISRWEGQQYASAIVAIILIILLVVVITGGIKDQMMAFFGLILALLVMIGLLWQSTNKLEKVKDVNQDE